MPNKTVDDAPSTLPMAAKKIYVAALNSAYEGTCKGDDACAAKVAWSAVKEKYKKNAGGDWVAKSEAGEGDTSAVPDIDANSTDDQSTTHESSPLASFSMFIHKATSSEGIRRWQSTASDTIKDGYGTRMSGELFQSFIDRIESGEQPPEAYRSDAWSGGYPYLGVAHYNDLNGLGIVGPTTKVIIDNNRFKASGVFDNPKNPKLVDAAFNAIRSDINEDRPDGERVRVSIGFLDWKHAHGQMIFTRKSVSDKCPMCKSGQLPDVYLDGQIVHLALTRVPVNDRTSIEAWEERSGEVTTRVQDAASIVGEEIADELEKASKGIVVQESLVTLSDAAAEPVAVKSDMAEEWSGYYGGALSIADAEEWFKAQQEAQRVRDLWWVFSDVMCNILEAGQDRVPDKAAAIKSAVDDFKSRIETGAEVMLSKVAGLLEKFENTTVGVANMPDEIVTNASQATPPASHPLDDALAVFKAAYDDAIKVASSRQDRLAKLQPAMTVFGQAVVRSVSDATPTTVEDIAAVVARIVEEKLAVLKNPPAAPASEPVVENSKAAPRQITAASAAPAQPVVSRSKGARVADIVSATVYPAGGGAR